MATATKLKVSAIQNPSSNNTVVVQNQLKESVETAQRLRGDPMDSFVRVSELTQGGLWQLVNGVLVPSTAITKAGAALVVADSITGVGTTASPLQLSGDAASPGNSMQYGTNVSGTKGWYAQPAGSSITVKDGSTTITGANTVTFSGAIVSGSTPNATVTIAGGGGSANVTPDTHPATATAWDDEFEAGSSINLSKWAWLNQGSSTTTVAKGALSFSGTAGIGLNIAGVSQSLSGAGSTWEFQAKAGAHNFSAGGATGVFFLYNSGNGKILLFGPNVASGGQVSVQRFNSFTSFNATTYNSPSGVPPSQNVTNYNLEWAYYATGFDGTNLYFRYSIDGIYFQTMYTETPAAFIGAPTHICVGTDNNNALVGTIVLDWFRKTI